MRRRGVRVKKCKEIERKIEFNPKRNDESKWMTLWFNFENLLKEGFFSIDLLLAS
jgi:hypothetical protein